MSRPAFDREQRLISIAALEVRVSKEGDAPKIEGYAAVFNQPSDVIDDWFGGFREYVAPGAFTKTLKEGADVRALLNHDPNWVLGRTKSGTLRLWEDDKGLGYEATPPDTQWARDLMAVMRRGDIDQSSFAFQTVRDRWGVGKDADGREVDERWLLEAKLFDVSPVTYPAYPQTTSDVRALLGATDLDPMAVLRVMRRALQGRDLADTDRDLAHRLADLLRTRVVDLAPDPVVAAVHPEPTPLPSEPTPLPGAGHSPKRTAQRRWLERMERIV